MDIRESFRPTLLDHFNSRSVVCVCDKNDDSSKATLAGLHGAIHGMAPQYLSSPRRRHFITRGAYGRLHQTTTFSCLRQDLCPSEVGRSLVPSQGSGTLHPTTSRLHHLFLFSAINWGNFDFRSLILTLFCVLLLVSVLRHSGVEVFY